MQSPKNEAIWCYLEVEFLSDGRLVRTRIVGAEQVFEL
jgi:hypothetical protein